MGGNDRVGKNAFAVFVYQVTALLFGLTVPQMILTRYGAVYHGLSSTVMNLAQYLLLINSGIVSVAMHALYKPFATNDVQRISGVVNAARDSNRRSAIVSFLLIVCLSVGLGLLLREDNLTFGLVFSVALVMGLQQVLERWLICTYQIILQADQKMYIVYVVNTIMYIIRGCTQILLIQSGASIQVVLAIPTVMILGVWLLLCVYVRRSYPYIDYSQPADSKALESKRYAVFHVLAGLVTNNSTTLILSTWCNQIAVSIFAVYNIVIAHLHGFIITTLSRSALASIGKMLAVNSKEEIQKKYAAVELVFCMCISFAYSVCSMLILPFVELYTSGQSDVNYINYQMAVLILVFGIFNGLREPAILIIDASAYYRGTQKDAITEILINIGVSIAGAMYFGMSGVMLGPASSMFYRYIRVMFVANKKILKRPVRESFRRGIQSIVIILVCNVLLNKLVSAHVQDWMTWIVVACIVSVICAIVVAATFYMTDREDLEKLLRKAVRKVKMRRG